MVVLDVPIAQYEAAAVALLQQMVLEGDMVHTFFNSLRCPLIGAYLLALLQVTLIEAIMYFNILITHVPFQEVAGHSIFLISDVVVSEASVYFFAMG